MLGRLGSSLLSLVLLGTALFFLLHAMPGGPGYAILGKRAVLDKAGELNMQLGLDMPLGRQFLIWGGHVLHGDLGESYVLKRKVGALIGEYAANSALLYGLGFVGAAMLALFTGLLHGMAWGRWQGRALGALELAAYAMPGFFVATLLIAVFSTWLGWLPASGMGDMRLAEPSLPDTVRHLVLPVAAVTIFAFAPLSRYLAQGVHEELGRAYVRGAAAKGVAPAAILLRHVLRNAMLPFVTMLGLTFPGIVSSLVVVESVFGYPGLGWLLWRAAVNRDYPVAVGVVLVTGVATILANLAADLGNRWLDPRLR